MVFHSQPQVEHRLDEKRTVIQNNFFFHEANTSHTSKINSFLDLK